MYEFLVYFEYPFESFCDAVKCVGTIEIIQVIFTIQLKRFRLIKHKIESLRMLICCTDRLRLPSITTKGFDYHFKRFSDITR